MICTLYGMIGERSDPAQVIVIAQVTIDSHFSRTGDGKRPNPAQVIVLAQVNAEINSSRRPRRF